VSRRNGIQVLTMCLLAQCLSLPVIGIDPQIKLLAASRDKDGWIQWVWPLRSCRKWSAIGTLGIDI